jgi:hypothetical protein
MAMRFPASVCQVEFDGAASWIVVVDSNHRVREVRARFPIPSSKLNDHNLLAGDRIKVTPEITGEPARL